MKQVKIINGVYGYKPKDAKFIEPVHAGTLCVVTDEEALRLTNLGIGLCIGDVCEEQDATPVATPSGGNTDGAASSGTPNGNDGAEGHENGGDTLDIADGHFTAESLSVMTIPNLAKLAADLGADVSKCKKKADYVDVLAAVEVQDDETEEEPPVTGAAEPVV